MFLRLLLDQRAQETFEYILVVGLVVAALIAAIFGIDAAIEVLAGHSCPAVDTAKMAAAKAGSCIG